MRPFRIAPSIRQLAFAGLLLPVAARAGGVADDRDSLCRAGFAVAACGEGNISCVGVALR